MAGEGKPVRIGLLQRHATDWLLDNDIQPFQRAAATGKRVAVVGGGPAGLSCAHRLAMLGHSIAVFEARPKLAGLNEYGIAAYKTPHQFAQREVDFVLGIGGIDVRTGQALGRDITLEGVRRDYDAVFLGIGLTGTKGLSVAGEELGGVEDAVAYIERLRQATDLSKLPIGRSIVVIGGGNTAVDIAVQAKRLGAEDVTIVYRRGPDAMSATSHEQEFAQVNGVRIKYWARPARLIGSDGRVTAAEFEYTQLDSSGRLTGTGETFTLAADQVFKAIGQVLVPDPIVSGAQQVLEMQDGKIAVDDDRKTALPNVWAGGDCITGVDLTVQAVQDGKVAAHAIDRYLRGA
jgi:glutamate synthase (NADPH/NADH) small chain